MSIMIVVSRVPRSSMKPKSLTELSFHPAHHDKSEAFLSLSTGFSIKRYDSKLANTFLKVTFAELSKPCFSKNGPSMCSFNLSFAKYKSTSPFPCAPPVKVSMLILCSAE